MFKKISRMHLQGVIRALRIPGFPYIHPESVPGGVFVLPRDLRSSIEAIVAHTAG